MRRYPRMYAARSQLGDLVREHVACLSYFPTPLLGPYLQSALSSTLHMLPPLHSPRRTTVPLAHL